MRKLLYIPILHTEADLGRLAPALSRESMALCGQDIWEKHKIVVSQFWQKIADYLLSLDITSLRIYQDGLAIDGEEDLKIVEEAARRGSLNHGLILELVQRGASIRKTEDPALLISELQNLLEAIGIGNKSTEDKKTEPQHTVYRKQRDNLMKARDQFIAETINETLKEEETGVLLLGSYHDIRPFLAPDIAVREVKEIRKVRAYLEALLVERWKWQTFADYLTSPITQPLVTG